MKLHKEGQNTITASAIIFVVLSALGFLLLPQAVFALLFLAMLVVMCLIVYFFREPKRERITDERAVFSPADGKVVVCEEVSENECFGGEKRLQVSIFMSVTNVHINWYPVSGKVAYFRHHQGKYLVAWHPKSSEENEHTTTVIDTGREKILFRQIAGFVARRIVAYSEEGREVEQNTQCGFIKFGSRIDLLLPLDCELNVKIGDKVTGGQTPIAIFSE